jgi:segregation and condensation protein A
MESPPSIHDKLFEILFDKDDITWQTLLYKLVKSEGMDPWDIDISLISDRFIQMTHLMKKMDLRISGKVILAAAILLRIKSTRLVSEDISYLDSLFAQSEEEQIEEGLVEGLIDEYGQQRAALKNVELIPRMPQPRKRKVSIYDLVIALQKAMEVKKRRIMRDLPALDLTIPKKKVDISELITGVFGKIKLFFLKYDNKKLTFSYLVPDNTKEGKVYTFIPLLHLTNQRKIDMYQYKHFGEIEIELLKMSAEAKVNKEVVE